MSRQHACHVLSARRAASCPPPLCTPVRGRDQSAHFTRPVSTFHASCPPPLCTPVHARASALFTRPVSMLHTSCPPPLCTPVRGHDPSALDLSLALSHTHSFSLAERERERARVSVVSGLITSRSSWRSSILRSAGKVYSLSLSRSLSLPWTGRVKRADRTCEQC